MENLTELIITFLGTGVVVSIVNWFIMGGKTKYKNEIIDSDLKRYEEIRQRIKTMVASSVEQERKILIAETEKISLEHLLKFEKEKVTEYKADLKEVIAMEAACREREKIWREEFIPILEKLIPRNPRS